MKRHSLIAHLHRHGCELLREGAGHSLFWHPISRRTTSDPRHTEIANRLALKICKDLDIPAPGA